MACPGEGLVGPERGELSKALHVIAYLVFV